MGGPSADRCSLLLYAVHGTSVNLQWLYCIFSLTRTTSLFFYGVYAPFSTSYGLTTLRTVLLFIDTPITAPLFSLLLLLLLLLSEAAGLVLGFAAVYYSPHVSHTYTRHFLTS